MAYNEEDLMFYGGMNSDDEDRMMPDGDYREAFYLRGGSFIEGSAGVLQNIPGDVLVTNTLPSGSNLVIGTCEWNEQNAIIYFVFNGSGNHSIWKYAATTGVISLIVQSSVLNFQLNSKIVNAFVLDGMLFWTDGYFSSYLAVGGTGNIFAYNPPRMGNIGKLETSAYSTINFQLFDVIKWPPRYAPSVVYANNGDASINLYGQLFQFTYKYIYENNEESCWGPISDLPIPNEGYWMSGANTIDIQDNEIDVTYDSGDQTVVKIVHAFRFGNDGEFQVWKTIDKSVGPLTNNTNYTIPFTNNSFGVSVPLNAPNYHLVPQVAGCQEILTARGGELSYGDVREGYDPVALSVALSYRIHEVQTQKNAAYPAVTWSNPPGYVRYFFSPSPVVFPYNEGDLLFFQLVFLSTNEVHTIVYTVGTETTIAGLIAALVTFLNTELTALGWVGVVTPLVSGLDITNAHGAYADDANSGKLVVTRPVRPVRTWKTGTTHKIGIKYEDRANRDGTVMYVAAGELVLPSYSQFDTSGLSNVRLPFIVEPQMAISNTPPTWATHYRICTQYSTTIESFGWYNIRKINTVNGDPTKLTLTLEDFYVKKYGVGNVHQIQPGDKIRFIRKPPEFDATFDNQPEYIGTDEDNIITVLEFQPGGGQDGTDLIVTSLFDWQVYDLLTLPSFYNDPTILRGCQIEVFRTRQTSENEPWFESPSAYPILNPHTANRRHGGGTISGNVIDMDSGTQEVILAGDLSSCVGYSVAITGTGTLNDGLWTVATVVSYNALLNQTTLTFTQVFPSTTATVGTFSVILQQTSLLPAVVFLGSDQGMGDIYLRPRHRATSLNIGTFEPTSDDDVQTMAMWEEDPAYSDYYPSSWYGRGRISLEDPNAEGKRLTATVVHGKNYLQNTNVNGLNVFEYQDRETLNDTDGILRQIVLVGDTLQCIQERKNTSIYIQRAIALDPNGVLTYSLSDKTFGGKRPRQEDFGTRNKESVIKVGGMVYYFDMFNSKFVVSTNNEQKSLVDGEFKFSAATSGIAQTLATQTNPYVIGFHDQNNNEIGWVIQSRDLNKIVVFDYEIGRWKYYMTHTPQWIGSIGNVLVEFASGQLYKMNQPLNGTANNFNTFFTNLVDSVVKFVSRKPSGLIKNYNHTIGVKSQGSTAPWALTSVDIPANLSYSAMNSRIPATSFAKREGYYRAKYKRDINTPNAPSQALAVINGRELRGYEATHTLTLDNENKKTTLFAVKVLNQLSEVKL